MRRYGEWAGSPKGSPEDKLRCVAEIAEGGRSIHFQQCSKRRGHGPDGLFCGLHAKRLAMGKYVDVPDDSPQAR